MSFGDCRATENLKTSLESSFPGHSAHIRKSVLPKKTVFHLWKMTAAIEIYLLLHIFIDLLLVSLSFFPLSLSSFIWSGTDYFTFKFNLLYGARLEPAKSGPRGRLIVSMLTPLVEDLLFLDTIAHVDACAEVHRWTLWLDTLKGNLVLGVVDAPNLFWSGFSISALSSPLFLTLVSLSTFSWTFSWEFFPKITLIS